MLSSIERFGFAIAWKSFTLSLTLVVLSLSGEVLVLNLGAIRVWVLTLTFCTFIGMSAMMALWSEMTPVLWTMLALIPSYSSLSGTSRWSMAEVTW